MAGNTLHNDLLNLDSPAAALINSLGTTGLTPLGGGADGLGITTSMNAGATVGAHANPEIERLHRLQMVANTLKDRVIGHGITRQGVERTAQINNFMTLWDEDNLSIAGNCVDLEINFESDGSDQVRDVSLKLGLSGDGADSAELVFQEQGTQTLKENLRAAPGVTSVWKNLDDFAANIQYLGQLDNIDRGAPCFNAVIDLYDAFQKIWSAERAGLKHRIEWQQIRRGRLGRPVLDRKPRLGLSLSYWVDGPDLDHSSTHEQESDPALYTARIGCEAGLPFSPVPKQWLGDQIWAAKMPTSLSNASLAEAGLVETASIGTEGVGKDIEQSRPDWQNAQQTIAQATGLRTASEDVDMDGGTESLSQTLNFHFYCDLVPEVYLPMNAAEVLSAGGAMLDSHHAPAMTYQAALQKQFDLRANRDRGSAPVERWLRRLPLPPSKEILKLKQHSYALQTASDNGLALWCVPVNRLIFNHPRQLDNSFGFLRQHIVLWRLLRSLVDYAAGEADSQSTSSAQALQTHPHIIKRTNKKTTASKFDSLTKAAAITSSIDMPLPIDITLGTMDGMVCKLDIYVPLTDHTVHKLKSAFIFLSVCVSPGGSIVILDSHGLPVTLDVEGTRSKLVAILEKTEDIGLCVEWLLQQVSTAK
jgi:hypothetical protein